MKYIKLLLSYFPSSLSSHRTLLNKLTSFNRAILRQRGVLKHEDKIWIKLNEFNTYFKIVLWATNNSKMKESFAIFNRRIKVLVTKGSFTTTFNYLKEVLRLTIRILANQIPDQGKVLVQCDKRGLPTILPWQLREVILLVNLIGPLKRDQVRVNRLLIIAILSCISIFRVFPTVVKPSLKTIIKPFDGISKTLNRDLLLLSLNDLLKSFKSRSLFSTLNIRDVKLLLLETASPNGNKSTWGSVIDAITFIDHPRVFLNFVKLNWFYGFKQMWLTIWIIIICIAYIPVSFLIFTLRVFGKFNIIKFKLPHTQRHIASLGVVYDQAGKARIVGISNYWVQCLLHPIHSSIFSILKDIEQDGTFNQLKPLKLLISRVEQGQKFYSFDLSAATDRLPVELQSDILDLFKPGLGTLWANLLTQMDYSWLTQTKKYVNVRYSVGQPMGAYSSWAMLALTHHIIVRYAAINAKIDNFQDYAVLGDDIVIANDIVANEYMILMNTLGVSINLGKTLQSDSLCEFAKKWMGHEYDFTPIGPGIILNALRSRFAISALMYKLNEMLINTTFAANLDAIKRLPVLYKLKDTEWNNNWVVFGLYSFSAVSRLSDVNTFVNTMLRCFKIPFYVNRERLPHLLINSLQRVKLKENENMVKACWEEYDFLNKNFIKINTSRGKDNKLIEFLLKFLSPCYWVYSETIFKELASIYKFKWVRYASGDTWEGVENILTSPERNPMLVSADWKEKKMDKIDQQLAKAIREDFEKGVEMEAWMLKQNFRTHHSHPHYY